MNRGKGDWVGQVTEAAGHTFISLYLLTLDSWVRRGESFPCSLSSCALGPDSTILSLSACSQPCTVWKAAQGIPGLIEQKEPRVWRAARGSRLAGELAAAGRARTRSLLMTRLNISCSGQMLQWLIAQVLGPPIGVSVGGGCWEPLLVSWDVWASLEYFMSFFFIKD